MDKLMALYRDLNREGVSFFTWELGGPKAVTMELNGQYAVFMDFDSIATQAEERVVVAHEGGHVATGSTHTVSSPYDLVEKHEYQANKWAIARLVPKEELDAAVSAGYTEPWELAERFGVPQPFLEQALDYYRRREDA